METTIDKAGRLVIPKAVREQAGLSPGTRLEISYRDGKVEIEPVVAEAEIVRDGPVWGGAHSRSADPHAGTGK